MPSSGAPGYPVHVWVLTNEEIHKFRELTLISRSVSANLVGLVRKPETLGQSGHLYEAELVETIPCWDPISLHQEAKFRRSLPGASGLGSKREALLTLFPYCMT